MSGINLKRLEAHLIKLRDQNKIDLTFVKEVYETVKNDLDIDAVRLATLCENLMSVVSSESDDAAKRISSSEKLPDNADKRINMNKGDESDSDRGTEYAGFKNVKDPKTFNTGSSGDYVPSNPFKETVTSRDIPNYTNSLREKDYDTASRKELANKGNALPDGSYPIADKEDLKNAEILANSGHGDVAAAKRLIAKRKKELGVSDHDGDNGREGMHENDGVLTGHMPDNDINGRRYYEANNAHSHRHSHGNYEHEHSHMHENDSYMNRGSAHHMDVSAHSHNHVTGVEQMNNTDEMREALSVTVQKMLMDGGYDASRPNDGVVSVPYNGALYDVPFYCDGGVTRIGEPQLVDSSMQGNRTNNGQNVGATGVHAGGYIARESNTTGEWFDSVRIIEAANTFEGKEGKEWEVMLIAEGLSKNGNKYSYETLQRAVPLFEGKFAFADHSTNAERISRPERSVRDKVGVFRLVHMGEAVIDGVKTRGVVGLFKLIDLKLRETFIESMRAGEPDFLGFSIDAEGNVTKVREGNRFINNINSIDIVHSVDVVTDPSAGGKVMRLIASNRSEEDLDIKEQVREALKEVNSSLLQEAHTALSEVRMFKDEVNIDKALSVATLSPVSKERIRGNLIESSHHRALDESEIVSVVKDAVLYEAAIAQQYANPKAIAQGGRSSISTGMASYDYYDAAIRGMFENGNQKVGDYTVKPFLSIKEAYCRWTGADPFSTYGSEIQDAFFTKYDSRKDHDHIRESLSLASWGSIYADNLYIQLIKSYRNAPYDRWKEVVSDIENVPDFQTRHWTRVGGYQNLPTVAEQATYTQLTTPTNEAVSYSIAKKGGIDDVTFESIVDDRFGAIRRIPQAMGRSAARTLYYFVMDLVTQAPATYTPDGFNLYDNTNHKNDPGLILSVAALAQIEYLARQQTAYGEASEILGARNKPKVVIVPNTLEYKIKRILDPSDAYAYGLNSTGNTDTDASYDPQAFKGSGITYQVYDNLGTSTTEWYTVADPNEMPTFVMGFLNGNQEPELFVQDQPTVGSVFTADKISYKVRHIYGGVLEDYRSFFRGHS